MHAPRATPDTVGHGPESYSQKHPEGGGGVPLRPHPHGVPTDPEADKVLSALEQRTYENVDEARGISSAVSPAGTGGHAGAFGLEPGAGAQEPHGSSPLPHQPYLSGEAASLQVQDPAVAAAHRAHHPPPPEPAATQDDLPPPRERGSSALAALAAAKRAAAGLTTPGCDRAQPGTPGGAPQASPAGTAPSRAGGTARSAPLAEPYTREGGPYNTPWSHSGMAGGMEHHGNATPGPTGMNDVEEMSREAGREGHVREVEAAISGGTRNTGEELSHTTPSSTAQTMQATDKAGDMRASGSPDAPHTPRGGGGRHGREQP